MPNNWLDKTTKVRDNVKAPRLGVGKVFVAWYHQAIGTSSLTERDKNFCPSPAGPQYVKEAYFICCGVYPGCANGLLMTAPDWNKLSTGLITTRIPTKRASSPEVATPSPFRYISYTDATKIPDQIGCVMLDRIASFVEHEVVEVVGELLPDDVTYFLTECENLRTLSRKKDIIIPPPPGQDTGLTTAVKRYQLEGSTTNQPSSARKIYRPTMSPQGTTGDRKRKVPPLQASLDTARGSKRQHKDVGEQQLDDPAKAADGNRSTRGGLAGKLVRAPQCCLAVSTCVIH
ncbi:hypothetical protein K491DRAFT_315534 [Lophiostoma macrostomum CBS 122681]|uniref:Uncharacterized protein n=1 Tax=Lophiostoma macrostomum CBS 122681 TaxID=1314788 RepID=A0A6A6TDG7_9PLEO|nr:hypothetical protein K491DRAFT_315534 [Lophiostoma macrostomum CBS 122681]